MNYNWTPANTPQGRERFKQLLDQGYEIATRRVGDHRYKNIITHSCIEEHSGDLVIDNDIYEDWEEAEGKEGCTFDDLEFIDPSPESVADPFAEDRALVASAFIEDDFEKELMKHAWSEQFIAAIKRLAGLEAKP